MKSLTSAALTKIAEQYGNEAIAIVDVQWIEDSGILQYADRDIATVDGRILSISNLDAIVNVSQNNESQEIDIVLDDTDGSIKSIIDNNDVHKRDVWVYQWFEGLDFDDRFLLFKGKINSPIEWSENDQTVSFTVISQIEDNEIGFSVEEGQFENLPKSLIGQAWPMIFGTYDHAKALRLTERTMGILADGVGFADVGLQSRAVALGAIYTYRTRCTLGYNVPASICDAIRGQADDIFEQKVAALNNYEGQKTTERSSMRIFNGENFPQNKLMYVTIGNTTFYGKIRGNIFYFEGGKLSGEQHPAQGHYNMRNIGYTVSTAGGKAYWGGFGYTVLDQARIKYDGAEYTPKRLPYAEKGCTWYLICGADFTGGCRTTPMRCYPTGSVAGDNMGYVYLEPGTRVQISEAEPQDYVVSITPGTVLKVSAWAEKDGQRFLQDVPTSFYTVYTEEFGDVTATIIRLNDALSKDRRFNWSDEVYVTFQSTIGPNTVDILKYLIETYSDFEIDNTSFNYVKTKLEKYPSNFVIYDRKELLNVLQEIAWQARCAIWLKNGVFYLKYLPEQGSSIATITESDIEVANRTLVLSHTSTEDLVTKMICEWRESGLQEDPYHLILRHNIKKYGTHKGIFDFYIYDFQDAVLKSATFWLVRYANTWKKVRFQTPLTRLNVETFDTISLNFDTSYIANVVVPALIEDASFDSANNTMSFECWCPVKSGTMEVYDFAYPVDLEWEQFPTKWELDHGYGGGNGPGRWEPGDAAKTGWLIKSGGRGTVGWPGKSSEYAEEDPYNMATIDDDRRNNDRGNPTPGDVGDKSPGSKSVFPTEEIGESNPGPPSGEYPGVPGNELNKYGLPGNPDDYSDDVKDDLEPEEPKECTPGDLPDPSDIPPDECNFRVDILWAQTHYTDWGTGWGVGCGTFVNGPIITPGEIMVFNDCETARTYGAQLEAMRADMEVCTGDPYPYLISYPEECGEECERPPEEERGMIAYRASGEGGGIANNFIPTLIPIC